MTKVQRVTHQKAQGANKNTSRKITRAIESTCVEWLAKFAIKNQKKVDWPAKKKSDRRKNWAAGKTRRPKSPTPNSKRCSLQLCKYLLSLSLSLSHTYSQSVFFFFIFIFSFPSSYSLPVFLFNVRWSIKFTAMNREKEGKKKKKKREREKKRKKKSSSIEVGRK